MPYLLTKVKGGYKVVNRDTGVIHSKHTTKTKAESQIRLLNAIDHGFTPKKIIFS